MALAQQNYRTISYKFTKLLRNISSKLQSVVNTAEFQLFVVGLFHPGDCIPNSASVYDIFCAITKNGLWDCVNYFPLKQIIEEFASEDTEMSEWVKQYEEDRCEYLLGTKVSDHFKVVAASDSSDIVSDEQLVEKPAKYDARYYHKLSLKVKTEVSEMSMRHVSGLWESFASYNCLPSPMAILDSVHDKCTLVTWLVPTKRTLELVKRARADPDFFQAHNVLWTRVDYNEYLYNSEEEPANMLAQSKVCVNCCSAK